MFREYMVAEGVQQYKDYFETDAEEAGFMEHLDNLSNREKIRFMECYEDFTTRKMDTKNYVMIRKREYNPELSAIQNMVLDLVDFKDRVRPLSRDLALMESTRKYQKQNVEKLEKELESFAEMGAAVDALDTFDDYDPARQMKELKDVYTSIQTAVLSSDMSGSDHGLSTSEITSDGSDTEYQKYRRR